MVSSFFLTGKTCPLYEAPKNGALACNEFNLDYMCVVMCRNEFDFVFNPAMLYFCSEGEWQYYVTSQYSYPQQLPWPDCSSKLISLLIITVNKGRLRARPHISGYFEIFNSRTICACSKHVLVSWVLD